MPFRFLSLAVLFVTLAACTASPHAPARDPAPTVQDQPQRLAPCAEGRAPYPAEVRYSDPLLARLGEVPPVSTSDFGEVIDGIAYPQPMPTYPIEAAIAGEEGACLVYFDLSMSGHPVNVAAACTSEAFTDAAETALRQSRFPPAMENGEPVRRERMVYPLTFCQMR